MKIYLYFLLILSVALIACKKDGVDPDNESEDKNGGFESLKIKTN